MFLLHPELERDTAPLCGLGLCDARLRLDARFPWIILAPRLDEAQDFEDIAPERHAQLMADITHAGRAVRAVGEAAGRPVLRLNVGLLGNIVPQLHIHVVGRRSDDPAWPGPVWGHGQADPYSEPELKAARTAALAILKTPDAG